MANKKLTELSTASSITGSTLFLVDDGVTTQTANGNVIKSYIYNSFFSSTFSISVDVITTGNLTTKNANLGNLATANFFSGAGNNLSNIQGSNVSGFVANANVANTAYAIAGANVSGFVPNANVSNTAYAVTGSNVSGQVSNALVAGTVYTNAQPNITSVGNLTSLIVLTDGVQGPSGGGLVQTQTDTNAPMGSGNRIAGYFFGGATSTSHTIVNSVSLEAFATQNWTAGAHGSKLIIATTANGASSRTTAVTINQDQTSNFANTVTVTGNVSASYIIADGSQLTNISNIANLTQTNGNFTMTGNLVPSISNTYTLGTPTIKWANLYLGPNSIFIQDTANSSLNAELTVTNGILQVNGATGLQANLVSGNSTLTLATNGNINMSVAGTSNVLQVTSSNVIVNGNSYANYFIGNGHSLNNIAGANVTGYVPNANVANTAYAVTGSNVTGAVAYATTANSVAGANISGQVGNALVAGTVYTASQPNITSVGSLTDLSVSGNATITGNLTVSGTTTTINSTTVSVNDVNIVLANNATNATQANGAGITINGASATMNYISSTNTFTFSHKIVADGSLLTSITGANVTGYVPNANIANTAYAVAGANVTGQVGNALVAGTVYTNAQPNITSVGTLSSLIVTANITSGNANLGNAVTANYFIGNGSQLTGLPSGSSLVNGTSNIAIASSGNINLSVSGTSNVLQVTSSSAIVNGDLTVTGNVNITGNVNAINYGSFGNTANITAGANTATPVLFDTTIANLGITKGTGTSNSRIIVNKAGTYAVKAQLGVYQNGPGTVVMSTWFRKNGSDIAYSQDSVTLNNNPTNIWFTNDIIVPSMAANDYIEVYWALVGSGGDVGHIKLLAQTAQTSPFAMPASPSVIVTVTPVA